MMARKRMKVPPRAAALLVALGLLAGAVEAKAAQQYQGLCSQIKMEILQEMSLERVGFLATLKVTNNEGDASITDFSAALNFHLFAPPGVDAPDASDLFFVQPPKLQGIDSIDGAGVIPPGQTATVTWFIIPKIDSGGQDPVGVRYNIGADLAGSLYGQPIDPVLLTVIPDSILVKPEPQLQITYFQPRDVDGDDPFTPDVESPIPFTLGVLVQNAGYGPARDVRVVSQQPKIVENKQHLLLVARLLGARVDDQPTQDASLTLNLGDIDPGGCRKGAWDMITSLSGTFTEFKASYTHASELGGRDTSIIKDINAYFIVHEVLNDQPGRDSLKDFLADTVPDDDLIPDTLYESDCNVLPVNRLLDVAVESYAGAVATVRATADFENWVYLRLDDPAQAKYPIASVVRSDGKVLNPNNYWTSVAYRPTDNAKLTYLNIFDFVSLGEYRYTVTYRPNTQDVTPPVTHLRFSGEAQQAGGAYYLLPETQVFFTVDDESPVSIYYRLDGAPDFQPAYPFQIAAAGQHTLEFYSKDAAGNTEAVQTATLIVSGDYPAVSGLTSSAETLFATGDSVSVRPDAAVVSFDAASSGPGLTGTAEVFRGAYGRVVLSGVPSSPSTGDSASIGVGGANVDFYRYRLNGGAWSAEAPASQPLALSGLSGVVTLDVLGRSQYGVYPPDTSAVSVSWTAGTESVSITTPPIPSGDGSPSLAVSGTASYCYRVDGGAYQPDAGAGTPIALNRLTEGPHQVEVLPRASAGEACPADGTGVTASWVLDRGYATDFPASERVRTVDLGTVGSGPVQFSWDGRDDAGQVVPPGWYSVRVTVSDGLGRETRAVRLVQVGDLLASRGTVDPTAGAGQLRADAAGQWVVWQDQRNGDWDIYARNLADPAATSLRLTGAPRNQERPRTDGRYVVWEDRQADGSWDVWGQELAQGATPFAVTVTPGTDERRPSVSWPWVVYQRRSVSAPAAPWQLEARNLATGETRAVDPTTQDELDPCVQDGRVVWQDFRDAGYGEIYLADLQTGAVTRITDDPGGQYHPSLSGPWVVWEDNRNGPFDLYGYDLLQGKERRLTDTAENETQPRVNGHWVLYGEDSSGVGNINLRLLHLGNGAVVQVTNSPSAKDGPSLASGWAVWVDSEAGYPQVEVGHLPDLQPVFQNQNTVAVTQGMADRVGDAYGLLRLWNATAGVTSITRYANLLPQPTAETATWDGTGPTGDNFPLVPGSFLWVHFGTARILDLGSGACGGLAVPAGTSALSYPCFPDGYSAYRLIRELGVSTVNAVRVLDAATGQWRSASVVDGNIVGEDFPIPNVAVLLLDLAAPAPSWTPGGGS